MSKAFIEHDIDKVIVNIMPKRADTEWMACIYEVLLGVDEGYAVNTIDILWKGIN